MTQYEISCEFDKLLAGRREIDLVQFMLEIAADADAATARVARGDGLRRRRSRRDTPIH